MSHKKHILKKLVLIGSITTALTSCSNAVDRIGIAKEIAIQSSLASRDFPLPDFTIKSWSRISDQSLPITIYIEGDGYAWVNKETPSMNPTPKNPIGLKLASLDPAQNVIYLARPCQYTEPENLKTCSQKDWTSARFSRKIIDSYDLILNQISSENNEQKFNLIGFSGGANIAGLLASHRDDILSLRTVAGNIDNAAFIKLHHVSPMPESLNMADYTSNLEHIPQIHFIAENDQLVPPAISRSYIEKTTNKHCIQTYIATKTSHNEGWENIWTNLLKMSAQCTN